MAISFLKFNPDLSKEILVTRKGKYFEIDGKKIELFRRTVLAEILNRTAATIKNLEFQKKFPTALYRMPSGKNFIPYYSRNQLEKIIVIRDKYQYTTKQRRWNNRMMYQEIMEGLHKWDLGDDV